MALKTFLIKGKAKWAKICGSPPPGYQDGPPEWSFDLYLDEQGVSDYLASKGDKFYLKADKETGQEFLRFTRKATRQDGVEAKPIRIIDKHGDLWNQSVLIGNDSELDVQFTLNTVRSKGQERRKPSVLAVMVRHHEAYKPKSGFQTVPKPSSNIMTQASVENWASEVVDSEMNDEPSS